jgi:hypothetical protein
MPVFLQAQPRTAPIPPRIRLTLRRQQSTVSVSFSVSTACFPQPTGDVERKYEKLVSDARLPHTEVVAVVRFLAKVAMLHDLERSLKHTDHETAFAELHDILALSDETQAFLVRVMRRGGIVPASARLHPSEISAFLRAEGVLQ